MRISALGSLLLTLPLLAMAGCRSKDDVPYLGRWEGSFAVHRLTGRTEVQRASRNGWKGYLLLYRTQDGSLGNRCSAHFENEQEAVDLKGHWLIHQRQIALTFNDIKIDDAGGLDSRDPNKAYLKPEEIHSAFATPLILNIAGHGAGLESPVVEFGPLEGQYRFSRAALGH